MKAQTQPRAKPTLAPPLAGLPRAVKGKPLAWVTRELGPNDCAACGLPQNHDGVGQQAILCGRCLMVIADTMGPQVVHLSPEERYALNRAEARRKRRK